MVCLTLGLCLCQLVRSGHVTGGPCTRSRDALAHWMSCSWVNEETVKRIGLCDTGDIVLETGLQLWFGSQSHPCCGILCQVGCGVLQLPVVHAGYLDIVLLDGQPKRISIGRAHLEEDAGKQSTRDAPPDVAL